MTRRGIIKSWTALLLLFLTGCCLCVSGQVPWTEATNPPSCHPYISSQVPSLCVEVLNYEEGTPIFIPGDVTWDFLVNRLGDLVNAGVTSGVTLNQTCREALSKAGCATHFRRCVVTETETYAWPVRPCEYLCHELEDECGEKFRVGVSTGIIMFLPYRDMVTSPKCNETDHWTNDEPFFSETQNFTTLSNLTLQCSAPDKGRAEAIGCEEPLVNVKSGDSLGCGFRCPLPSLTDEQYEAVKIAQAVIAWLSLAATSLLVITYGLNRKLRRFPANLIMMSALSANIAAGALCLATMIGEEDVWCGDEVYALDVAIDNSSSHPSVSVTNADALYVQSPLCTLQAATFWWFAISLNMLIQLYMLALIPDNFKANLHVKFQLVMHPLAWGLSFLFALIPAAANKIGFTSADTLYAIFDGDVYFWLLWVAPFSFCLLFGTISFLCCIIKIFYVCLKTNRMDLFHSNIRVSCFVLVFMLVYTFIFAYSIKVENSKETVADGYNEYLTCLFLSAQFGMSRDDCELDEEVANFPLVVLRSVGISCLGLLLFFTFVSTEWFKFYKQTITGTTRSSVNSGRSNTRRTPSRRSKKERKGIPMETLDGAALTSSEKEDLEESKRIGGL
ncbi:hypothetical protein QOT17_000124 [Balamuthia mandrillaris]